MKTASVSIYLLNYIDELIDIFKISIYPINKS